MKKIVIGILAHVDAGKTTLLEGMLYLSGVIKQLGRVDTGNSFLDFDVQERNRGITIFSSQAICTWKDTEITFIDTPGHHDFSTEMERTLQILDYALVVIDGNDGIQNHTETIWKLLKQYQIPTFVFINKMDMEQANKAVIMQDMQTILDTNCIDFTLLNEDVYEKVALVDETYLEYYLEHQTITNEMFKKSILERKIFPCFFGSALKVQGIDTFLDCFIDFIEEKRYGDVFGAKVYKVTKDPQGTIVTHVKVTGGTLHVKDVMESKEKVNQIRLYCGTKYTMVDSVDAGSVCSITGLSDSYPGQGLGMESQSKDPCISSFMQYKIILPKDYDAFLAYQYLQQLEKEDPQLQLKYHQDTKEMTVLLMGDLQIEILKHSIKERFSIDVDFDQGSILYKETITKAVVGIGHFEPLRHYAEVQLLLEPGPLHSGLQFDNKCKEEMLSPSLQRAVLLHVKEKQHVGVLTGSPITDIKITLLAGKGHIKHTEGGDFREATYRAIRHGLKSTESIVLEPYYRFYLEVPSGNVSKAIYDLDGMKATYTLEQATNDMATLQGEAPVIKMQHYQKEVALYTKGKGRFHCQLQGYQPCHNFQEIMDTCQYNSESDIENPTGSIFCKQGAGFYVPWNEVEQYAHIKDTLKKKETRDIEIEPVHTKNIDEEQVLEQIFTKTYGAFKPRISTKETYQKNKQEKTVKKVLPQCLLIDGYNVIFSWPILQELAKVNLDAARYKLLDLMCNYQGYKNCMVIVVFDGYKVRGNIGSIEKYHNIYVTYTKEAQTADMYIEKVTHHLASEYYIVVATSDAMEQMIVVGHGGHRISTRELALEMETLSKTKLEEFTRKQPKNHQYPLEALNEKLK